MDARIKSGHDDSRKGLVDSTSSFMTIPVIDAHHHIWRQADLPWLSGPMVPRIFGPYQPLRRDYPIDEFLADIAGSGVVASVYVQANWAPQRAEDEVAWVQRTADESGWPHAIVSYADLLAQDVRPALDRLSRYPLLRGVRMQLHWHEKAEYRFASRPDLADDPTFRRNFAALGDYGLSFDLQVFAGQMAGAGRLAADFPGTTFILQHAGMLEDLSERGREAWRSGMQLLAAQPNVVARLSGLGTFIHRDDPEHIAAIVRDTVALFGPKRCLYGSNFPIEKLWTSYRDLLAAYRAALSSYPEHEQRAMFCDNAARIYRIG
jgi:predicted TIM-barrel fold metal-dependent hydrolase